MAKTKRSVGHYLKEGRTGRRILRLPPGLNQYFITFKRVEWH